MVPLERPGAGAPANGAAPSRLARAAAALLPWVPAALGLLAAWSGRRQLLADAERLTLAHQDEAQARDLVAAALETANERFALASRAANDGLWDWELDRHKVYLSSRWRVLVGLPDEPDEIAEDDWLGFVHSEDRERLKAQIEMHLGGHTPRLEDRHRVLHSDGDYRWVLCRGLAARNAAGRACRLAGSLTDITERKQAEEQLLHDAFEDKLTGLPNRAIFMDHLKLAWAFADRSDGYAFAVLFLDLDRFKVVNDSLGHNVGDELLVCFARKLETCLRPGDTVARFSGDEFVVLLDDIRDDSDALRVAEHMLQELWSPFTVQGHDVYATASIGIALSSSNYKQSEDMIRDANVAMYRAKAGGKARHEMADASMHSRAVALLKLETDLRRAVEKLEGLAMYYQPIVSLETGRITGFESLIRWFHPTRGMISPNEFVPVAEETGLIVSIGRWALREACAQLIRWQHHFPDLAPLTVSVNLSSKQLAYPRLVDEMRELLEEFRPLPGCFRCEITESVIMANADDAINTLLQLRELGVQLYIDDFGTGYSSLSYLQRLPVDTLKIDRSFVTGMNTSPRDLEIVRAIAALAHTLGMDVIVEGVETREQLAQLRLLQCEYGQGFLFSPPLDGDSITILMETNPQW